MREQHFDNAVEFANHVRRSHERWGSGHSHWVYRGQRADFPLTPSLWRKAVQDESVFYQHSFGRFAGAWGAREEWKPEFRSRYIDLRRLLWAEREAVAAFRRLADDLGFHVPILPLGDPWYSSDVEGADVARVAIDDHIPTQATALAQHHSMPTRLLDWTEDPFTAVYFAAMDWMGYKGDQPSDRIVLWAFETKPFKRPGREFDSLVFVRPDRAPNPFMRAQRGLFSWHRDAELEFMQTGVWPTHLDPYLKVERSLPGRPRNIIQKLTMAASAVPELVKILMLEQVTRVHMMPTLDNVAHTVKSLEHYGSSRPLFEHVDVPDDDGAK